MAVTLDLKKIRENLESEKTRIMAELDEILEVGKPSAERREGSPFGKREEEATESMELERRLAQERRINEQLADIENALNKIDSNKYGICENCGKKIEPARLKILPQARLCLSCKTLQSKNAKR